MSPVIAQADAEIWSVNREPFERRILPPNEGVQPHLVYNFYVFQAELCPISRSSLPSSLLW
jgi:hypothetical protein